MANIKERKSGQKLEGTKHNIKVVSGSAEKTKMAGPVRAVKGPLEAQPSR